VSLPESSSSPISSLPPETPSILVSNCVNLELHLPDYEQRLFLPLYSPSGSGELQKSQVSRNELDFYPKPKEDTLETEKL